MNIIPTHLHFLAISDGVYICVHFEGWVGKLTIWEFCRVLSDMAAFPQFCVTVLFYNVCFLFSQTHKIFEAIGRAFKTTVSDGWIPLFLCASQGLYVCMCLYESGL